MLAQLHLEKIASALFALCLLGAASPASADRHCILLGMMGPLPPECTDGPAKNSTRPAFVSISSVNKFADGTTIADAASVLTRNQHGVSFRLNTSELQPDHAYTIWWVIFNAPRFCSGDGGACTEDDLFNNPDVDASVAFATGAASSFTGRARFSARLFVDQEAPGQVLFGPALTNPDAEIHLVVRTHGPVGPLLDEGALEAALGSFNGGCILRDADGEIIPGSGPNECADVQFAIHRP